MSIKSILYIFLFCIVVMVFDGVFSKREYHKAIIIAKNYVNNTGRDYGNDTGGTPFAPIPEQKEDPNGYIFSVINKNRDIIHLKGNKEIYNGAYLGDDITYIKLKGLLTKITWKVKVQKTEPNILNRIKYTKDKPEENLSPIEKMIRDASNRINKE